MEKLYTIDEAAKIIRRDEETVKRYIRLGKLRATKLTAKTILVPESALQEFIDSHMTVCEVIQYGA